MKIIGLTGGIGMGKSTAAAAFRRAHIPVFDADAAVHALQSPNGRALPAIAAAFPGTVTQAVLDRAALRQIVLSSPTALKTLESILHPMVRRMVQMQRVGRRRKMSPVQIAAIIARQTPDLEKRHRADRVIQTGLSRHHALRQLRRYIIGLTEGRAAASKTAPSAPER
jgi:dephospho-CoA kinase